MKRRYRKVMCGRCGWVWKYRGKHVLKGEGIIACAHCHTTLDMSLALKRARGRLVSVDYGYVMPIKWRIREQIKENKKKIEKMEVKKDE